MPRLRAQRASGSVWAHQQLRKAALMPALLLSARAVALGKPQPIPPTGVSISVGVGRDGGVCIGVTAAPFRRAWSNAALAAVIVNVGCMAGTTAAAPGSREWYGIAALQLQLHYLSATVAA